MLKIKIKMRFNGVYYNIRNCHLKFRSIAIGIGKGFEAGLHRSYVGIRVSSGRNQ